MEEEGGQRSERSERSERSVSSSGPTHLVLVGAVLMTGAVGLLGVDGVDVRPAHNTTTTQ